jgi:hypothetical protein
MVKHEIKVEFNNSEALRKIIETAYFDEGFGGKILGKKHYITIDESDDINHTIFRDMNNVTVKITNDEVIDGSMRFGIDETDGEVRLYPISIYSIKEENRYIFY